MVGLRVRRLLNPKVRFSIGLSDGGRVMVEVRITSRSEILCFAY